MLTLTFLLVLLCTFFAEKYNYFELQRNISRYACGALFQRTSPAAHLLPLITPITQSNKNTQFSVVKMRLTNDDCIRIETNE